MCSLCYEHVSQLADTNVNLHANAMITSDYATEMALSLCTLTRCLDHCEDVY